MRREWPDQKIPENRTFTRGFTSSVVLQRWSLHCKEVQFVASDMRLILRLEFDTAWFWCWNLTPLDLVLGFATVSYLRVTFVARHSGGLLSDTHISWELAPDTRHSWGDVWRQYDFEDRKLPSLFINFHYLTRLRLEVSLWHVIKWKQPFSEYSFLQFWMEEPRWYWIFDRSQISTDG